MSGLVDPVTGWLAGLLGDGWVALLRGSPDERLVRRSMANAVEAVIARADSRAHKPLRKGLALVFTKPPAVRAEASGAGDGLRAAVVAQVDLLRDMGDESGRPFFETVSVDPDWLAEELAEAFVAALERAVTASSPAELVGGIRAERASSELASVPDKVAERISGSLADIRDLLLDRAARSAEEFQTARERYLRRLLERYGRVDLEILTPLTEQGEHPHMLLGRLFVPQAVRENPPPVDLPREVWRRLAEEGQLEVADLPPELDRTRLEEARRTYQERPARPVLQALADPAARKTVVLGDPGAGKSTLARYLMLALAEENAAEAIGWQVPPELTGRLPMLVELRTFADQRWRGKTFLDMIDELERGEGLGIPGSLLEEFLRAGGRALVIFDGLDEIFDPRVRAEVTRQIEGFAARYPSARVVVTSRVVGYSRGLLDGAGFAHYMLQDLDPAQIQEFATTWYRHSCAGDPAQAERLRDRLLGAIDNSTAVAELAGNPMLLTILAIIGRRRELPRDRRTVYQHAVMVLVEHWDVNKHLRDESADLPLLDHEDKLSLLHLIARRMQDGPAGLAGNHLPATDLLERFEGYLDERFSLPKDRSVPAARAMLRQFQERNFILSSFGAGVYGFVHRAFLEYLAADDIYHRFNARELDEQELFTVFDDHWADPAWAEVLLLLAGMIPERFAVEAITRLLAADPRWRIRTRPPRHLILGLRAIGEVRRHSVLAPHARTITRHLTHLLRAAARKEERRIDSPLIGTVESVVRQLLDGSPPRWLDHNRYLGWYETIRPRLPPRAFRTTRVAARLNVALRLHPGGEVRQVLSDPDEFVRVAAVEAVASGWPQDPQALTWLQDRAANDPDGTVRAAAVQAVASGWPDDPHTLTWLQDCTVNDPDGFVRGVAVGAVASEWPQDPQALTWLQDRATNDPHEFVRAAAAEAVASGWPDDPHTLTWLQVRAANDPHEYVRVAAVEAVASRWSDDPHTLTWLQDRAVNDPDESVRVAAVQAVASGWPDNPHTLTWLQDRAANDPHEHVRRDVKQWVSELEAER
ncbi:MAG TPA: HEAT repeat domain-containing protein [Streptosporangiaceae bacterium]|nr:HEAT repeat domain-containing protein [Streptosporangiaceae bacterium]